MIFPHWLWLWPNIISAQIVGKEETVPRGIFGTVLQGGASFDQEPERQWDKGRVTDRGGGASLWGRVPICEGEMGRLQTYPRQQRAPGGGNIAALQDRKWQNKYKWRPINKNDWRPINNNYNYCCCPIRLMLLIWKSSFANVGCCSHQWLKDTAIHQDKQFVKTNKSSRQTIHQEDRCFSCHYFLRVWMGGNENIGVRGEISPFKFVELRRNRLELGCPTSRRDLIRGCISRK